MDVFMYADNPGVYLNVYAKVVPSSIAKEAGFDIVRWAKAKQKRDTLLKFKHNLDEAEALDEEASRKVLDTREGFTLIELPLGRGSIAGPDGDIMVPAAPMEIVRKSFEDMFPIATSEYEADLEAAAQVELEAAKVKPIRGAKAPG
jgi:hypothetical protein